MKRVTIISLVALAVVFLYSPSFSCADSSAASTQTDLKTSRGLRAYEPAKLKSGAQFLLLPDVFENRNLFDCAENGLALFLKKEGYLVYSTDWPKSKAGGVGPDFSTLCDYVSQVNLNLQKQHNQQPSIVIGHGIGGLAALMAATRKKTQSPKAIICIGTPGCFFIGNKIFDDLIKKEKKIEGNLPIPTFKGATTKAPFPDSRATILDILLTNDKNFDAGIRKKYYGCALEPIARPLAKQIIRWIQTKTLKMKTKGPDLRELLSKVNCPVLFIAGKIDNIVDPAETLDAYNRIGFDLKGFRLFSTPNNYKTDYGHTGLLLGPNAHREVFPYILKWLRDNEILSK